MSAKSTSAPETSVSPATETTQGDADIRFDPRRFMSALNFHARESGSVDEVSASSISLTMRRLIRQRSCAVISRGRWASLTNPQRLQWLLKVTRTEFEATSEGYGVFKERPTAPKR